MGRSTAASKRQDQRNDFISKVAVDLGLPPELSTIDRVLLWQAADLLLWNPVDRPDTSISPCFLPVLPGALPAHARRCPCRALAGTCH
jgi:hypothetical protein